jgi:hypothetical protein
VWYNMQTVFKKTLQLLYYTIFQLKKNLHVVPLNHSRQHKMFQCVGEFTQITVIYKT